MGCSPEWGLLIVYSQWVSGDKKLLSSMAGSCLLHPVRKGREVVQPRPALAACQLFCWNIGCSRSGNERHMGLRDITNEKKSMASCFSNVREN